MCVRVVWCSMLGVLGCSSCVSVLCGPRCSASWVVLPVCSCCVVLDARCLGLFFTCVRVVWMISVFISLSQNEYCNGRKLGWNAHFALYYSPISLTLTFSEDFNVNAFGRATSTLSSPSMLRFRCHSPRSSSCITTSQNSLYNEELWNKLSLSETIRLQSVSAHHFPAFWIISWSRTY